jgi:hypothetical protein
MGVAWPNVIDRLDVLGGAVSLIDIEPVFGVLPRKRTHQVISGDFGQYRCGCNGRNLGIATDDGSLCGSQPHWESVNDDVICLRVQGLDSLSHSLFGCLRNADSVHLIRGDMGDMPGEGDLLDLHSDLYPALRSEPLGVIEILDHRVRGKNYCGSGHRTCDRPASDFIDARDENDSLFPKAVLQFVHTRKTGTLSLGLTDPSSSALKQRLYPCALITGVLMDEGVQLLDRSRSELLFTLCDGRLGHGSPMS